MSESHESTSERQRNKFDICVLWMEIVQSELENGEYVDGKRLADALQDNRDEPVPPEVLDYLCQFLEGQVKKPRGRKKIPPSVVRYYNMILRGFYDRYLEWLTVRKKRYGHLQGWAPVRDADFWQGPPNEKAARMVARKFSYGAESWRTVHNRISSQK